MKKIACFLLVVVILLSLIGCSSGISQEDYDKVVAELTALKKELQKKDEVIATYTENNSNEFPGIIQLDESTKIYAFKSKHDEKNIGVIFCDFDGANLEREGILILGCFTAFHNLNMDDTTAYDFDGNLVATAPNGNIQMAQKYKELSLDNEEVMAKYKNELTVILSEIK